MTTDLTTRNDRAIAPSHQRSAQDMKDMVRLVQEVMQSVMKPGEHFGTIPGCGDKPTLLKPGAEKLCMTFRLAAEPEIQLTDMGGGHREYRVLCKLTHIPSGDVWGVGLGVCSTMESKYRWRGGARLCPKCNKATIKKSKYPPRGAPPGTEAGFYCFSKIGGCGAEFAANDPAIAGQSEAKTENPDIADTYNTVLKMAKKRALVDATLTATAASDCFTQDLEEMGGTTPAGAASIVDAPPDDGAPWPADAETVPAVPTNQTGDEIDKLLAQLLDCFVGLDPKKWERKSVRDVRGAMVAKAALAKRKFDVEYLADSLAECKKKLAESASR